MAAKCEQVPVFYREQNDLIELPGEIWSREECRERRTQGLGRFENHGRSFRLFQRMPAERREFTAIDFTKSSRYSSDAAISCSELQANVGIVEEHVRNPRSYVAFAREKVRHYLRVFDDQAALARGLHVRKALLEVTVG